MTSSLYVLLQVSHSKDVQDGEQDLEQLDNIDRQYQNQNSKPRGFAKRTQL